MQKNEKFNEVLIYILLLITKLSFAQEKILAPINNFQACLFPPKGGESISYKKIELARIEQLALLNPSEQEIDPYQLTVGKFFHHAKNFEQNLHKSAMQIDWTKEKVLIIRTSKTYYDHQLEYSTELSGVYQQNNNLIIGYHSQKHSPCQGIAKEIGFMSSEIIYYYLILPKDCPEQLQNISCYLGPDCSGIP